MCQDALAGTKGPLTPLPAGSHLPPGVATFAAGLQLPDGGRGGTPPAAPDAARDAALIADKAKALAQRGIAPGVAHFAARLQIPR